MKKFLLRVIIIVLILFWMWMVFGFSSDNAEESSSLSFRISKFLVHEDEKAEMIQPYVRKLAHLSEYAAGRFFVLWSIFNISIKFKKTSNICWNCRNFVRNI